MKFRAFGPAAFAVLAIFLVPAAVRADRPPSSPLEPRGGVRWESDPWRPDVDIPSRAYVSPNQTSFDGAVAPRSLADRRESALQALVRFLRHVFVFGGGTR